MASPQDKLVLLRKVHNFLGTSLGRDKVAKVVHYGSRGVAAVFADLGMKEGETKFRALYRPIMEARRAHRWLTSTGVILKLYADKCPWGEERRGLFVTSSVLMICWHLVDHIRWLQKATWLPGDEARSRRISFTFFMLASAVALYHHLTDKEYQDKLKNRLQIVKNACTVAATAHIGEAFMTHEAVGGFGGMIAALIDIYNLWK